MTTAFLIACMVGLCVLLAWYEHRFRLGEAVEREVMKERRRVTAYLRRQAHMAESVSKCAYLGSVGQGEERYAAAVLDETATEISECAHHQVRP